jgi:hypothetical protein
MKTFILGSCFFNVGSIKNDSLQNTKEEGNLGSPSNKKTNKV